jgi:4-aminobutyrate aminotransferase-like enzyme
MFLIRRSTSCEKGKQVALHHADEPASNVLRDGLARLEPRALRTYTPTQAALARSAGVYHWTPEGRRLYDFTSGVLVANLGHNPRRWHERFCGYLGWQHGFGRDRFFSALPLNTYNAVTGVEIEANQRLVETMQARAGGQRLQQVVWAASGSEAIQKALAAALARDRARTMILATRFGFHGKKGLADAVSGCETDCDRDPRVCFISFPMAECTDIGQRGQPFDAGPYERELEAQWHRFGRRLTALITEPYLGASGSYHPPAAYLQLLETFCREHDLVFILDEVQANFGRTRKLFAYEAYGIEPDIVVLGKSVGNGVPVAAAVGRADLFGTLDYGDASDTFSANPLSCAAVLATLEQFAAEDVLAASRKSSSVLETALLRLKQLPFVAHVRGEEGGMVWGLETQAHAGQSAAEWANRVILACYRGLGGDGIHVLGALAEKVLRVAPPLVLTEAEARSAGELMFRILTENLPSK